MAQLPDTKRLQQLARKFLQGTISDAEQQELDDWFLSQHALQENAPQAEFTEAEHRNLIFDRIQSEIRRSSQQKTRSLWPRIAAAACIILALSVGGYFLLHKRPTQQIAQNQIHDIAPGRNQATLTLAGGQKIILIPKLRGLLATQGNTLIQVGSGKAITYAAKDEIAGKVEYNTLSTARGEQSPYPLVLADGTKVWLNAASSIKFPTAFTGKDREISLTGEAYIEVAHNASKPFRLINKGQTIEDIGTHFDVNAYDDERIIKTTLLEGSVKVTVTNSQTTEVILKPGQQSVLNDSNLKVQEADVDQAMSWRHDKFLFDDEPLADIMRQVSRWYNVDITYDDPSLKAKRFGGVTARFANVSQLLNTLEMTGKVKFAIQGRKIIVQDK